MLPVLAIISLYPLVYILAESFSGNNALEKGLVVLWPVDFNFENWAKALSDGYVFRPIINSAVVTVVGTISSILVSILLAYPTSKKSFRFSKIISLAVVFTMILKSPMIPYFLTIRSYGLMNNPLVLILPNLLIPYNYFVLKTFFQQTPDSLEESALMDGANFYQILFQIVLPISKAALATIGLFYAVLLWNQFYHPKLFIMDEKYYTIQLYLRQILDRTSSADQQTMLMNPNIKYGPKGLNAVSIIILTLPILVVYPFIQKHFVKGATLGAIKG
ncbi:MAG: carbohydrate ABC transporter permease [Spirochaetaceae bacterium]